MRKAWVRADSGGGGQEGGRVEGDGRVGRLAQRRGASGGRAASALLEGGGASNRDGRAPSEALTPLPKRGASLQLQLELEVKGGFLLLVEHAGCAIR